MYVIIWEFRVRSGHERAFERAYGPGGDWAQLFERGAGYLGTELIRDTADPLRYLTIDRWSSLAAFDAFRAAHHDDYLALDQRLERLTAQETHLGSFTSAGA